MTIKAIIRDNIALNAHETGCEQAIRNQINELKDKEQITDKALNVLIIGGSSGYGLASRIALTFKANAYTYNVSFERPAKGRSTASAGYYNNQAFEKIAKENNKESYDLNADAFSHQTKEEVMQDFIKAGKKIDLFIYSVASGIRIDPDTQEKYVSALKPIGNPFTGKSIDIAKDIVKTESIDPATEEEIENTRKVMGGEDYLLWIEAIHNHNLFNDQAQALTYTYIGSDITYPIYKDGTIGNAKRDLESTLPKIQNIMDHYHGKARVSSSKTVVTKASVFIPTVALYASALFKVMKEENTHETITEHKFRLFKDFIFNNDNQDELIRLDSYELDPTTQDKVKAILSKFEDDLETIDFDYFKKEFNKMNGFDIEGVEY